MAEEKQEVKKEIKAKYVIGEVVTGTTPSIIVDGEAITEQEALVLILNKLEKIEKSVA